MSWEDDTITIVRSLVNDQDSEVFSDDSLLITILVAAFQVKLEMSFAYNFVVSISKETIKPDPTDDDSKDDSFINLTCLKAACIIDHGSALTAANRAIAVKDGTSAVDLRGVVAAKLKLLEKGWCAVYDDAKTEYLTSKYTIAGAAIMTPFRLDALGGSAVFLDDNRNRDNYF